MAEQTSVKRFVSEESDSDSDSDYELARQDMGETVTHVQSEGSIQIGEGHSIVTHRNVIHNDIQQNVSVNVTANFYIKDGHPPITVDHQQELEFDQNLSKNLNLNLGKIGSLQIPLQNEANDDQGQPEVEIGTPQNTSALQLSEILSCRPKQSSRENHRDDQPNAEPEHADNVTSASSKTEPSQTRASEVKTEKDMTRTDPRRVKTYRPPNQKIIQSSADRRSVASPGTSQTSSGSEQITSQDLSKIANHSSPKSTNSRPGQSAIFSAHTRMRTSSRIESTVVMETRNRTAHGGQQTKPDLVDSMFWSLVDYVLEDIRLCCNPKVVDSMWQKIYNGCVVKVRADSSDHYFAVYIGLLRIVWLNPVSGNLEQKNLDGGQRILRCESVSYGSCYGKCPLVRAARAVSNVGFRCPVPDTGNGVNFAYWVYTGYDRAEAIRRGFHLKILKMDTTTQ